jgi:hypothetical protein
MTDVEVLTIISDCGVGMDKILLFLVRGCLRGYFEKSTTGAGNCGVHQTNNIQKACGVKVGQYGIWIHVRVPAPRPAYLSWGVYTHPGRPFLTVLVNGPERHPQL